MLLLLPLLLLLLLLLLWFVPSSVTAAAAASGAIVAGKAADRWGPRHAQVVNCIAFMLGALLAAGARHYRVFLMGRFVSGIGEAQNRQQQQQRQSNMWQRQK
jgi:MFS family permease